MYFKRQKSAFSKSGMFEEQKINISLETKEDFLGKSHRIAETAAFNAKIQLSAIRLTVMQSALQMFQRFKPSSEHR